jgi:AraC-like DNA-binding protein
MDVSVDQGTRGILHPDTQESTYSLTRYPPSAATSPYVKHYWVVQWDLRGSEPYDSIVLSHPNLNLVFERERTMVYGIPQMTSVQRLQGRDWVIGVKFRAGGFYPFWEKPVSELADRAVDFHEVFGMDRLPLTEAIFAEEDGVRAASLVDAFLCERLPARDPNVDAVDGIVRMIQEDRMIRTSEDAARLAGMSLRTMQRLFARYVGVSPKWVIQRYRLHEAAERAVLEGVSDWTAFALELGYYDQPHFIRAFKAFIGLTPEEYTRKNGRGQHGRETEATAGHE